MGAMGEPIIKNNEASAMKLTLQTHNPGDIAQVTAIDTQNAARLHKLSALGVVPGSLIKLQQRRPAYVVQVGQTQLSLDDDVAREIMVQPIGDR